MKTAAILSALLLSVAAPVAGQTVTLQCAPRDGMMAMISDDYGETRRAIGIAGQGAVMELFASEATGTWTATLTLPNGQTCLVMSGTEFAETVERLPANL